MDEDFQQHVAPWAAQFPERLRLEAFNLESFRNAASWIASRAFGVDDYHGESRLSHRDTPDLSHLKYSQAAARKNDTMT